MNQLTALLVEQAVTRVRADLLDQQSTAVIGFEMDEGLWLTSRDYWLRPEDFEQRAGAMSRDMRCERIVFAVPLVTLLHEDGRLVFRPTSDHVHPEEVQQVWIVSLDLSDGLDIHRCVYRHAADGLLFFDEVQTYTGEVRLDQGAPGWQLVQVASG